MSFCLECDFQYFQLYQGSWYSLLDVSKRNWSFPRVKALGKFELHFETSSKVHHEPRNNGLHTSWNARPIRELVNNRLSWQLVPWELGRVRVSYPNPNPYSHGNSN